MSQELGHTIDEVESLIKKHEAFEKSAAAQEDRFSALQRLTTVCIDEYIARGRYNMILGLVNVLGVLKYTQFSHRYEYLSHLNRNLRIH